MIYRHAIIVPLAIRDVCNLAAHQLGIDPDGALDTMSVRLGSGELVTHYGACGCMSEAQRIYLENNQASFPGARWWRWIDAGPDSGKLAASWDGENLSSSWSWEKSLEACNLTRLIPSIP